MLLRRRHAAHAYTQREGVGVKAWNTRSL
jgi:hypothetical protein